MKYTGGYALEFELRLTADGHDFASAITKPNILDTIKEKFQKEGLSAVIDIAKKLVLSPLYIYHNLLLFF